ncbi:MAG: phosphoribosylanthranilate isomerase [Anaerolineae bacterium]|nr:phosphoribosylanthranilate isomerase [Anaerolineae bacterium]
MTKVKICGITTLEDAVFCAEHGADLIGFNFYKRSPRYIDIDLATDICDSLRTQFGDKCPRLVGIFVNELVSNISIITNKVGLDGAQLSGDESDSMLKELRGIAYKGVQPMTAKQAEDDVAYYAKHFTAREYLPALLLDAYHPSLAGGTGLSVSADIIHAIADKVPRLMLAGGYTPDNVAERVKAYRPWGVDVASGVETDGKKDQAKIKAFIEAAKSAS